MTASAKVLAGLAILLCVACSPEEHLDSDAFLRATLTKKKSALAVLVRMAVEDPPMQIIARDFVRPEKSSLTEMRLHAYRDSLRDIGALSVTAREDKSEVLVDFSSGGMAFDSVHKGLAFIPRLPASYRLVPSLDHPPVDGFYLVAIEDGWYIYYLR